MVDGQPRAARGATGGRAIGGAKSATRAAVQPLRTQGRRKNRAGGVLGTSSVRGLITCGRGGWYVCACAGLRVVERERTPAAVLASAFLGSPVLLS